MTPITVNLNPVVKILTHHSIFIVLRFFTLISINISINIDVEVYDSFIFTFE